MAEKDELRTEFPQIYPNFYHILQWQSCDNLEFILFFLDTTFTKMTAQWIT